MHYISQVFSHTNILIKQIIVQKNTRNIIDLPQRVRERAVTEEPVPLESGRRRCPRDVESPREMREDDHHAEIKDERVRRGGSMSV